MSSFSPDLQKPFPDVMAEVAYWRGSITKWIKSSLNPRGYFLKSPRLFP
jgi:hypothetical protein